MAAHRNGKDRAEAGGSSTATVTSVFDLIGSLDEDTDVSSINQYCNVLMLHLHQSVSLLAGHCHCLWLVKGMHVACQRYSYMCDDAIKVSFCVANFVYPSDISGRAW
ncbi:cyclic diguanylate phosphodiesterase domain protein [Anopheles sinensis]|uniref:Cyclic diguanylate phosphodiesterase domain protein n=1 Tax=Anopheles sinensis TaxID=74873 RepID=A0A084VGF2_ANOSI|nr:cyclic diguanylate phosphodiesterase domain protein [Anopheles sinensis]